MFYTLRIFKKGLLFLALITNCLFSFSTSQGAMLQDDRFKQSLDAQSKGYQHIIFDVGNVLLEWNPLKVAARIRAEIDGTCIDDESVLAFTSSEGWGKWDSGTIDREELEAYACTLSKQFNHKIVAAFLDRIPYSLTPIKSGIEILRAVKARGCNVYVLSNMPYESLMVIKQQNDFFTILDGEIFSCNEHRKKPDLALYQRLLQTYNLDPAECLFIDDMQKNIDAAKNIGIDGILCTRYDLLKAELKRLGLLD